MGPLLANTNAITERYGLRVALSPRAAQQVETLGAAPRVFPALRPVIVSGGDPLLVRQDGRAVLVRARRGKGAVFVFGDGALFSTATMGPTSTVPDARRRAVYDLEYWLLQEAMELSPGRLANRRAARESPGLPVAWRGSRNTDDLPSRNGRTSVKRGG